MLSEDTRAGLGRLASSAEEVAVELTDRLAVERLWDGDHTLWRQDPTEIANRLGWLAVVADARQGLAALQERCAALAERVDHVLVMGMGGSSLFPEVLARTYSPARPGLRVLDSTDPAAVCRAGQACPPERTLHIAASKSGATIETRCHLEWAWWRAHGKGSFAVITDPGSPLADLARDRGFLEVFENRPDIGGRWSALSLFGLVPGLLAGLDASRLLDGAADALATCGPAAPAGANPALALAAALGAGARRGADKCTIVLPKATSAFGLWLEQLVAESLGKDGTGIVPVVGERLGDAGRWETDRLFVLDPGCGAIEPLRAAAPPMVVLPRPSGPALYDLGYAVVLWEVAVALAGAAIGVHPFDQPDVEAAKAATERVLVGGELDVEPTPLAELLALVRSGDHLALQAFVDPGSPVVGALEDARHALRDRLGVAVTLGLGPRYLHSTGQLHKGGPRAIVCAQVVGEDHFELDIPGRPFGFGRLKRAQATGDLLALRERGVRAARVSLPELVGVAS